MLETETIVAEPRNKICCYCCWRGKLWW